MSNEKEIKYDGGYGVIDNMSLHLFLSILPSESRLVYEEYLKEQDEVKYNEFKEWEQDISNNG